MARTIKLSEHRKNGAFAGFKKFVFGKMFYFGGSDRKTAEKKAIALMEAAAELQNNGFTDWTPGAIDEALQPFEVVTVNDGTSTTTVARAETVSDDSRQATRTATPTTTAGLMLHAACDRYLTHLNTQQVSQHTHWWCAESMKWVKRLVADQPLNQIGFDELTAIVATFRARPVSAKTKRPISIGTIRTIVGHVRDLFNYLADAGHWDECRRFDRIFKIKADKLMTYAEKKTAAAGTKSFTLDELAVLWKYANDQQRLYMITMLNTGHTQYDLATMTTDMVKDGRITRLRSKTSVPSSYDLWPVTRQLLADRMAKTPVNADGLALLTREGQPLVRYTTGKSGRMMRIDSVLLTWTKLLKHVKAKGEAVRPLSTKFLRKTGAQMLYDLTHDARIVKLYLSHSSVEDARPDDDGQQVSGKKSVAEAHYYNGRDFAELDAALQQLWNEKLATIFTLKADVKSGR